MNTRDVSAALASNTPDAIADVQSSPDARNVAISRVGIKSLRYPLIFAGQPTVAEFKMTVALPASQKGTHMSRFLALLESHSESLNLETFAKIHSEMLERLEASEGSLQASFPLFVRKKAPVTGVASLLDYTVTLVVDGNASNAITALTILVPVTSLCPCSKTVSDYGAHNQRSHVTITVSGAAAGLKLEPQTLIDIAEKQASSELYGLLKRADEKYVTERAYDNPKFVEDLVRDVAVALKTLQIEASLLSWKVEAENFEAIHNHSAYAVVTSS
jgi:GTP cyclohydrolase IB